MYDNMGQVAKKQVYAALLLRLSTRDMVCERTMEILKISVLNNPGTTSELRRVTALIVKETTMQVTGFSMLDSLQSFHILFVPGDRSYLLPINWMVTPPPPIAEKEGMISKGSGINFQEVDKRLKLEGPGLRLSRDSRLHGFVVLLASLISINEIS